MWNKLEMVPMLQKVREGGSELSQLLRCKEKDLRDLRNGRGKKGGFKQNTKGKKIIEVGLKKGKENTILQKF